MFVMQIINWKIKLSESSLIKLDILWCLAHIVKMVVKYYDWIIKKVFLYYLARRKTVNRNLSYKSKQI